MQVIDIISERQDVTQGSMGLTIFDIDDTLFHTTAQIKVMKDGKVVRSLTNQEFNNYKLQPGEEFDFGEFRSAEKFAKESEPIKPMINTLKRILDRAANTKVIMLTARADFDDKDKFLNTFEKYGIDMSRVHVHRAGNLPGNDPPAIKKAVWVRKYLNTGKYNRVNLIDDSMANLKVFKSLESEYPQVDFDAYFVKPSGSVDVVSESRKRKKAKKRKNNSLFSRNTGGMYGAWGPGPYGGYGYDAGYSGGGGDGGGGESVNEKIGDVTQSAQAGDTVYSIARQNNLDPAELMKFNGFTINTKLKPGQEVKIPQKKTAAPVTPSKNPATAAGQGSQPTPISGSNLETTLRNFAIKAGIKGKELAQFLAQCSHETANFATLTEFGDDFKKYDVKFNPQKAKTLGNTNPGDGERFKGRGFIQLTGRWNYTQAGQALGLPLDQKPQLLERPDVAAKASVWFWQNRVQPNVKNFTDTRAVTSFIKPGLAGLQQRNGLFQNYLQTMQQPVKKEGIGEDAMRDVIYTNPNLENEWEEAARYPEFVRIGKEDWIKLAQAGKAVTIKSAKGINNTDAADPDSFKLLNKDKQARALSQIKQGSVEMPIVAVYSDGRKELIGGNTRLTATLAKYGKSTLWAFKVPDEVARLAENFANGHNRVDFKKNLLTILQQKYPDIEFNIQSDRVESADGELIVIADTADQGSYVGCFMWDVDTGPYKGALGLAIKQTTNQLLQANPGKKPALFIGGDNENPQAWANIADKLNYKLITDDDESEEGMAENFADGKNPQDKGDSKRHGIPKKASISALKKIRSSDTASPRKKQLAHWQINMKQGRNK